MFSFFSSYLLEFLVFLSLDWTSMRRKNDQVQQQSTSFRPHGAWMVPVVKLDSACLLLWLVWGDTPLKSCCFTQTGEGRQVSCRCCCDKIGVTERWLLCLRGLMHFVLLWQVQMYFFLPPDKRHKWCVCLSLSLSQTHTHKLTQTHTATNTCIYPQNFDSQD